MTDEGFEPNTITIDVGDTVKFKTDANRDFWPASDSHPNHTIYPEFDPKRPLSPREEWSFRFDKAGNWRFHDHLASLNEGTIIVGKKINLSTKSSRLIYENCEEKNTEACWGELLKQAAKERTVEDAYDIFTKAFNSNAEFAQNCHSYTHILGQEAYLNFSKQEDFPVTDQIAACSYGFFHGFIEAMMQVQGNLKEAREMCDYIDKRLAEKTDTLGACLHGIGHGVTDGVDENTYGKVWEIINPGLELCQSISSNEREDKICATGVFNSIAIMYTNSSHGLQIDMDDPFAICREQKKDSYKHACFDDFKALIMHLQGNDFVKAANYVEGIEEDYFAQGAIDNLATYYVYYLLKDSGYEKPIKECYSLQERLHADCISGLGAGFMTASNPGVEYVRALELCSHELINPKDKDACHNRVIRLIRLRYSLDKYLDICKEVSREYQSYCNYYKENV